MGGFQDVRKRYVSLKSDFRVDYHVCSTVEETSHEIIGDACIIDPELHQKINESLGFDICIPTKVGNRSAFIEGIYVFDDTFEFWSNTSDVSDLSKNRLKSAKWVMLRNAQASSKCGALATRVSKTQIRTATKSINNGTMKHLCSEKNFPWQLFVIFMLSIPLIIISIFALYHVCRWQMFLWKDSFIASFIIVSFLLDGWTTRRIAVDIFHLRPFHIMMPDTFIELRLVGGEVLLISNGEEPPILDITKVEILSRNENYIFLLTFWEQHPYVDLLSSFRCDNTFCSISSSLGGTTLCSISTFARNEMGWKFASPTVGHVMADSTDISLVLVAPLLIFAYRKQMTALMIITTIYSASVFEGLLIGSLAGILTDAAIVPKIVLTTWPSQVVRFSYYRRTKPTSLLTSLFLWFNSWIGYSHFKFDINGSFQRHPEM